MTPQEADREVIKMANCRICKGTGKEVCPVCGGTRKTHATLKRNAAIAKTVPLHVPTAAEAAKTPTTERKIIFR